MSRPKIKVPSSFASIYENNSLLDCSRIYGVSETTIWRWAKTHDLFKAKVLNKNLPEPSQKQIDIINGSLLGDAFLSKKRGNTNCLFGLRHGIKQVDYLHWFKAQLMPYSREIKYEKINHFNSQPCVLYTTQCSYFTTLERQWYLRDSDDKYILNDIGNRIKIIPKGFQLNPLRIAIWFFDDGHNRPNKREAIFSTQGFTEIECDYLISQLLNIGIKSSINLCNDKPVIRVNASSYIDFITMVAKHIPCECMKYKVDVSNYKAPDYSTRFGAKQ